jgi:hypothetical protein
LSINKHTKAYIYKVLTTGIVHVPSEDRESITHVQLLAIIRNGSVHELDPAITLISGFNGKKASPSGTIALVDIPDDKQLADYISDGSRDYWWGVVVICKPLEIDPPPKKV